MKPAPLPSLAATPEEIKESIDKLAPATEKKCERAGCMKKARESFKYCNEHNAVMMGAD